MSFGDNHRAPFHLKRAYLDIDVAKELVSRLDEAGPQKTINYVDRILGYLDDVREHLEAIRGIAVRDAAPRPLTRGNTTIPGPGEKS